jgi:hypothetical protein
VRTLFIGTVDIIGRVVLSTSSLLSREGSTGARNYGEFTSRNDTQSCDSLSLLVLAARLAGDEN